MNKTDEMPPEFWLSTEQAGVVQQFMDKTFAKWFKNQKYAPDQLLIVRNGFRAGATAMVMLLGMSAPLAKSAFEKHFTVVQFDAVPPPKPPQKMKARRPPRRK